MLASTIIDQTKLENRLFINGEFVNSVSGKTFPTVNPATEEVICQVQEGDAADVDLAVQAATAAFAKGSEWRSMDASGRRNLMNKLANLIERDQQYLMHLESLDNGKAVQEAGRGYGSAVDLSLVIECFRYYAGWADKIGGKTIPVNGNFLCMTLHEPIGVVGQIIPWNFPLLMLAWKLGPALATGCTIVMKTSEKTPLTALAVCKLIQEAGFPKGVVNVISGYGPTAGKAVAMHQGIEKVAFTGSTVTGRKVQQYAAESNLKRVTLELGGKSPMIVCEGADLDQAAAAANIGIFLNHGQCCCAGSRLFVQDTIYDEFVKKVLELSSKAVVGDMFSEDTTQGPQVDSIQFDRIMHYINAGKKEGATVATGGERHGEKGYFIKPTIFTDVKDDMTIAKEEIFGPVLSILKFSTVDEVIERANKTQYGLAAGICVKDSAQAIKMAKEIRAGTVWINSYNVLSPAAPFGGFKESGSGRECGEYALSNYYEVKTIYIPFDQ